MVERTCLVTGKKASKEAFFRFTIIEGQLVFDTPQKVGQSRGGYVIKETKSISKLIHLEKKLTHFLKTPVKVDPSEIDKIFSLVKKNN